MAENNICCDTRENCGCVGYAYVPIQVLCKTYDATTALTAGTIFPELNLTIEEYGKICYAKGDIS